MKGPASGATPASGGVSREGGLDGPVATGRGEWFLPPSRCFLVRVSPQGQAGRSGAFEREARVPGGSLRGQPCLGSSLPAERATFRRGTPGGDFRAGGNLGEAGKPKLPNGNRKGRRGGIPIPSLGTAALSGASAAAAGIASLPGDAVIVWGGRQVVRHSLVPGAALAPWASGPSFAGHKVQGPWSLCAWRPLPLQTLSTRQLNFAGNDVWPVLVGRSGGLIVL